MLLVPVALAATICGLLLAPFCSISLTAAAGLLLACVPVAVLGCRCQRALLLVAFVAFFLLANLRYPHLLQVDPLVERTEAAARKVSITAEVLTVAERAGQRSQLDLRLLQLEDEAGVNQPIETVRLRLYVDDVVNGLLPGDVLAFRTRLRVPRLFGTPGEFHWPRYLASQGVEATGWLENAADLLVLKQGGYTPVRAIAAWKERRAALIDEVVPGRRGLMVRALLLGEAKLLPDDIRKCLAQAGVSHLFAISGLHLGLLGLFAYRLLFALYRRSTRLLNWQPPQRVLPLLVLPVLLGYLLLTGDAVSTRRAFCVACFVALFWWWRCTVNPVRLLLSLALLFLLFNPLLLWQPAWQLSFAGAAGILLWQPYWQRGADKLPVWSRAPVRLLLVSAAATLATLPLVLQNFHLLPTSSLLANLYAVPLIALLALPLGLGGLLLPFPAVAGWCFATVGYLLEFALQLTEKLLSVPGFAAHYLFLSRWQYLAIALLVLPFLLSSQPVLRRRLPMITFACLGFALLAGFVSVQRPEELAVYLFSVGQGEAILLVDKNQQAILIDGGGLYSERFDVGERLLAPAFGELGIRHLSAVLLSHDHPDHRKGLLFILEQFSVAEFWSAQPLENLHPSLQQVLSRRQVPLRQVSAGWSKVESQGAGRVQLFHAPGGNQNDSSVVLYLQHQESGLLLTGDLEAKGVQRLLAAGIPGPVDLLKVPHHGSRHSAVEMLLRQLTPELSMVSVGYLNRYRFPAEQVIDMHQRYGIPLYRTDRGGTIRARFSGGRWLLDHWQNGLFR